MRGLLLKALFLIFGTRKVKLREDWNQYSIISAHKDLDSPGMKTGAVNDTWAKILFYNKGCLRPREILKYHAYTVCGR